MVETAKPQFVRGRDTTANSYRTEPAHKVNPKIKTPQMQPETALAIEGGYSTAQVKLGH